MSKFYDLLLPPWIINAFWYSISCPLPASQRKAIICRVLFYCNKGVNYWLPLCRYSSIWMEASLASKQKYFKPNSSLSLLTRKLISLQLLYYFKCQATAYINPSSYAMLVNLFWLGKGWKCYKCSVHRGANWSVSDINLQMSIEKKKDAQQNGLHISRDVKIYCLPK